MHRKKKHICGEELTIVDDNPYNRTGDLIIQQILYYCPKCDDMCLSEGRGFFSMKDYGIEGGLEKGEADDILKREYRETVLYARYKMKKMTL